MKKHKLKKIEIFTDGACKNNPGPGGWAAILRYKNFEKRICGSSPYTTNNRMELLALINALSIVRYPCEVSVFSDSKYVVDSISKGRIFSWKKNGWMRKNKKIPNSDLWIKLIDLLGCHKVFVYWQKGHSGNFENEECDKMASAASKKVLCNF